MSEHRAVSPTPEPPSPAGVAPMILAAARPRQWTKNLFVFVAMLFAGSWDRLGAVAAAFGIFCAVSGGVYMMNDIADREQDRLHPLKCRRPIASGRLSVGVATVASIIFVVGGIAAALLIGRLFALITVIYVSLQIAYTFWLKHAVLLDVFSIAAGFVLRAMAGAAAIPAPNTVWLLVCTMQLALFLGFGKRRHELLSLGGGARGHRQALQHYSEPFLDQLISIVLGGLTVSYALYTITSETAHAHPHLVVTLPMVMYGIFRYLYLIHMEHKGGSPETILLEDRPMQANLAIWLLCVLVVMRFDH